MVDEIFKFMKRIEIFKKKMKIEWKNIAELRSHFTKHLSNYKDINPVKINLLVYIISELLENIVKYTSNHICYLILYLEINSNGNILHIITENERKSISDKNYQKLIKIIKQVNSYYSIEEMFFKLSEEYKDKESELSFGFALIKKLIEGNKIKLSRGFLFIPGIRIHVFVNC